MLPSKHGWEKMQVWELKLENRSKAGSSLDAGAGREPPTGREAWRNLSGSAWSSGGENVVPMKNFNFMPGPTLFGGLKLY